jgi:hypothetical protein
MVVTRPLPQADLELFCSVEDSAELSPGIVTRHAPDARLLAPGEGRTQARVSLWWQTVPQYDGERLGLLGHYAARDASAAAEVLSAACRTLAAQGCTLAVGPIDGSTWRRYRVLTDRGREPPFLLEPDNPDEWPGQFEAAGFEACARYYSSLNEDNSRTRSRSETERLLTEDGYRWRSLAVHDIESEPDRLWRLSSAAFRDNLSTHPSAAANFTPFMRRC